MVEGEGHDILLFLRKEREPEYTIVKAHIPQCTNFFIIDCTLNSQHTPISFLNLLPTVAQLKILNMKYCIVEDTKILDSSATIS